MNILLINHYAGSPSHGMEYRPFYLAREWVRLGHRVRISAAGFSHQRVQQPSAGGRRIARRTAESIDGIEYVWFPTPQYAGNGMGRVVNILAFLRGLWLDATRTVEEFRPDVVIASSTYPMDIWVARRISRLAGAKLVFEVHDVWPLTPIELGGMSPRHPFIRVCQLAEDTAYRDAELVVSMLPRIAEHMAAHGGNPGKLHTIPNGISPSDWVGPPPALTGEISEYLRSARAAGNLLVGYAGSHGGVNCLDILLDAAQILKDRPISFILLGDGPERSGLLERVQRDRLGNVVLFGRIQKDEVRAFLAALDIAYIGWRRLSIYRFGISPNKLMDYMMAGCPVVHAVAAGNDPVAEAGCGVTVEPESPQALADGIEKLAAMDREERRAIGARGRSYVETHHTYPVLAAQFLDALQPASARKAASLLQVA